MQTDAETIDGWWRGQDPTRTPRFDTLGFGCGQQLDISFVTLNSTAAELQPIASRFARILAGIEAAGFSSAVTKYIVYYDGPGDGTNVCGEGAGSAESEGVAIEFLSACDGLPSSVVVAHELLHSLGALPAPGPPHACPGDDGHPCDSQLDLLYPVATSGVPLTSLMLDVGHDDYYGHSGLWFDIQDSRWLRHLDTAPSHLSVVIQGAGTIASDVPGISCTASCESDWDANQPVGLVANAGPGMRFVRWSGGCTGNADCTSRLRRRRRSRRSSRRRHLPCRSRSPAAAVFARARLLAYARRVASCRSLLSTPSRSVRCRSRAGALRAGPARARERGSRARCR